MSALAEKIHQVSKVAARKAGTEMTFTLTNPGTYDSAADTWTGASSSTVVGYGERVAGDPERYKTLKLVESEAPTIEFTPNTYGERPPLNSSTSFGGLTYVVRDVLPVAPDGSDVSSRIVVAR